MSPKIPLTLRLKKARHRQIAAVQDIIVETLYSVFDKAVLHGGTAIWRCYGGNRFSEDVDVYIPKDKNRLEIFFKDLGTKGFAVEKKKVGKNSLFSKLNLQGVTVRFEALFKAVNGELAEYETIEGNLITIYSLLPEILIGEKAEAYIKRRKIRDLYDVFFLLRIAEKERVKASIKKLVGGYIAPLDEDELKTIIIEGIVPDTKKMIEYIRRSL
jgi:predicted nucleotidyltransferase component of viral defense system